MSASCCAPIETVSSDLRWRRALWIALAVNATMFAVELAAGEWADSRSLQADALDFFGDAANYAISLGVTGLALAWRARAALVKGVTLVALGGYVLVGAIVAALGGASPQPFVMGTIGIAALIANVVVALMLFRFRSGDSNMRSVWICSRNDAIANIAVVGAAFGVFGTGSAWPDLAVAGVMAALALWGGGQIIRLALAELASERSASSDHAPVNHAHERVGNAHGECCPAPLQRV